jgi:hypothetical protein
MSIGVDFILKANTAAFTRALATVDNATSSLRKGLMNKFEGRDLARGLVTAFGLSIERIADKFARLWSGMSEGAERAYRYLGSLTDTLTEKTIEAGRAKLTDEQRYQLALVETARLQNAIAENAGKTTEDQIKLTQDKIALLDKEREASEAKAKMEKEAADKAAEEEKRRKSIQESVQKAKDDIKKEDKEFQEDQDRKHQKAEDDLREKFAPSVEQLAAMSAGGFAAADDPRLIAKQILQKEKFAAEAAGRGDISGAIGLGREARNMRESLQNVAGSGAALTQDGAQAAFTESLKPVVTQLGELKEAVTGIIKAQ